MFSSRAPTIWLWQTSNFAMRWHRFHVFRPRIRADGRIGAVLVDNGIGTITALKMVKKSSFGKGLRPPEKIPESFFDWDTSGVIWVDVAGVLHAGDAKRARVDRVVEGRWSCPGTGDFTGRRVGCVRG